MNDQKIVQFLRKGERNKAFLKLYKSFAIVEKLILSKGGSKQEAEDIFQEALIIFYKKAIQEDFILSSSISTYVYSVARFLWKDEQIKKGRIKNKSTEIEVYSEIEGLEQLIEKEKKIELVEKVLENIGEKCLKILQLFYYQKLSMKVIARQVGLKSEKVAKNQKYKCLERSRQELIHLQTKV